LRTKSVEQIVDATKGDMLHINQMIPIIGDKLLPVSPVEALKSGKFQPVDLIFGVTKNEGSAFAVQMVPHLNQPNISLQWTKGAIFAFMQQQISKSDAADVSGFYTRNRNQSNPADLRSVWQRS